MKKFQVAQMAIVVLVLICTGLAHGAIVSPYWQRIGAGFPNQVTVYGLAKEYHYPYAEIQLQIPQLLGVADPKWQAQFNAELATKIADFVQEVVAQGEEVYTESDTALAMPYSGVVGYEVKTNRGGLLSLAITYYSFTGGAHGMTFVDYINIDLTTGCSIDFADMFPTEEELTRAASAINGEIAKEPEWFFIDQFTVDLFTPDQGFYFQEDQVIVCFGLYELAPYAAGIQEFAVSAP